MRPMSRWGSGLWRRIVPHPLRRRLRNPTWGRAVTAGLAVVTATATFQFVSAAADGASRYGSPRPVVVAVADLPAGHEVGPDDVEVVELPAVARPEGALDEVPVDRPLRTAAYAGQVLVEAQLGDAGRSGLAAALPPRTQAVAVPRGDATLELTAGDAVDVLALDAELGSAVVVSEATVLTVDDLVATLAVPEADVTAVATSVVAGTTVLTLRH